MLDTFKHKGLRKKLVETVKQKGIQDERVLEAIGKIPRHFFMDSSFLAFAYDDKPFPIGCGQTISQPYTVAFMTELLAISKGEKVLEVGTGSGYQACVLMELGAKVFTIERQRDLFLKTKEFLPSIGYNPRMFYGDGYKGLATWAPFDKIMVTAGAPFIPENLCDQLKIGGIMVILVGDGDFQTMKKVVKTADGIDIEEYGYFRFVPLLKDKES